MIKKTLFLLSCLLGSLYGKYLDDVQSFPLHTRVEIVKEAIKSRYDGMVEEVCHHHDIMTQEIVQQQLDLQAYMDLHKADLDDMAHNYLVALRTFANQQVLQVVPEASIDVVEDIHEYVEELHNDLSIYIFVFSAVGHVIEE